MAIKKVPASMVAKETAKMKQMPKKLTKPTGEYSKGSSEFVNWLVKKHNLTPADARTAAGKYRDMVKVMAPDRAKSLDATGAAMGKAIKQTKKKTK